MPRPCRSMRNSSPAIITEATLTSWCRVVQVVLLLSALSSSQHAAAHRLNITTSDIVWQPQDNALEVTHSLHLDDALALLARLGDNTGSLDLVSSARLMNYLNKHFRLVTAEQPLLLEPYGAHIDGAVLYMYQRTTISALPPALEVTNRILHDVVDGAQNQINWRVGEIVRSKTTQPETPIAWLTLNRKANPAQHSDRTQREARQQ